MKQQATQPNLQTNPKPVKTLKPIWIIIITVVITTLVVGIGMYLIMTKINQNKIYRLEYQTEQLKGNLNSQQISGTDKVLVDVRNQLKTNGMSDKQIDEYIKEKQTLDVHNPSENNLIDNPIKITGTALFYGGTITAQIKDGGGKVLGKNNSIIGEMPEPYSPGNYDYQIILIYEKPETESGNIEVCVQDKNICKTVQINFVQENENSKIYKNTEANFNLQYSSYIKHGQPPAYISDRTEDNNFYLFVRAEKIEELDYPNGYGKKTALPHSQALSQAKLSDERIDRPVNNSRTVIKLDDDTNAESFMVLNREFDVTFERKLIFYNNGYQIVITLYGPLGVIKNELLDDYFNSHLIWDYENNKEEQFYQDLLDGKGSKTAQQWFDIFDEIINTIEIY